MVMLQGLNVDLQGGAGDQTPGLMHRMQALDNEPNLLVLQKEFNVCDSV